jgi:hypothetical protein
MLGALAVHTVGALAAVLVQAMVVVGNRATP